MPPPNPYKPSPAPKRMAFEQYTVSDSRESEFDNLLDDDALVKALGQAEHTLWHKDKEKPTQLPSLTDLNGFKLNQGEQTIDTANSSFPDSSFASTERQSIKNDLLPISKSKNAPENPYLRKLSRRMKVEVDFDAYCLEGKYLLEALEASEKAFVLSKAPLVKQKLTHDKLQPVQRSSKTPDFTLVPPSKSPRAQNQIEEVDANASVTDIDFDSYCLDDTVLSRALESTESSLTQSQIMPETSQLPNTPNATQEIPTRSAAAIVTPVKGCKRHAPQNPHSPATRIRNDKRQRRAWRSGEDEPEWNNKDEENSYDGSGVVPIDRLGYK